MNIEEGKVGSPSGHYAAVFSHDAHDCHMTCKNNHTCMASSYLAGEMDADKPLCFLYHDIMDLQPQDSIVMGSSVAMKHCVNGKFIRSSDYIKHCKQYFAF